VVGTIGGRGYHCIGCPTGGCPFVIQGFTGAMMKENRASAFGFDSYLWCHLSYRINQCMNPALKTQSLRFINHAVSEVIGIPKGSRMYMK
jgi:hypothetical protein